MRKKILIINLMIVFLGFIVILGDTTHDGSANQQTQITNEHKINTASESTQFYLPCLQKKFCVPDPVDSPFSINISALHQITATNIMAQKQEETDYFTWYNQSFPTLLSALKDSGAGWTRVVIRWFDIEPDAPIPGQPPDYNTSMWQWYDNRLGQISQAGVKMIAVINAAPGWAGDGKICPAISPVHLEDYRQFISDLVNRYSEAPYNIKTWEIFNEADNTWVSLAEPFGCFGNDPYLYSDILQISYETIKSIEPDATILMSGIAYDWFTEYDGPFYRNFPDKVILDLINDSGKTNFFDAFNFHYFPDYYGEWERWNGPQQPTCSPNPEDTEGLPFPAGGIDLIAKKNYYNNRMSTCYGVQKPMWLTELSAHGVPGDQGSLRNQAYYVIKGYTRGLSAGIKNITWYALADNNDGFDQSLLYPDFSPKPGFLTYKTLIAQLTNFQYARALSISGGEAYVFRNSCNSEKIIAWGNNVPLIISPAAKIEVTDYLGEPALIEDGMLGDEDGIRNNAIRITLALDPMLDSTVVNEQVPIPVFIRVTSP
ncbi:MAG: hypothetical protein C3F13_06940 [Anaerolineales bacterium]|nr:MAG: hypothetical protein C3F13_06940 [Anaerolineales bacterium]